MGGHVAGEELVMSAKWVKVVISAGLVAVVAVAAISGAFVIGENAFYDAMFNWRGEEDPGKRIIVVAMDEKSFAKMGPLPWSRATHARLLKMMPTAAAVGFDLLFDMERPAEDAHFAREIKAQGRVVLATMFAFEQNQRGDWLQTALGPNPTIRQSAAGQGFVNMPADKGNIVRRTALIDTNTFGRPLPSFALACAMVAQDQGANQLILTGQMLTLGQRRITLDHQHQALIDFAGPGGTFSTISYADVLDGAYPPDFFADKIVLVGLATPTEKNDYYENPFTKGNLILQGKLPSPGVEIHANILRNLLEGSFRREAAVGINLVLLALCGLLAWAVARPGRPWLSLALSASGALIYLGGAYLLWLEYRLWVWIAAPLLAVFLIYAYNAVADFVRTEMERRRTRALFSRYVSGQVVDSLLANPEEVGLGGIRRDVTVLFSDVRGFTAYSDNRSPEEVVTILNRHFSEMTQIIFAYGGMLDKYIGDAIMAVFGAPLPTPDHPQRAVEAGLAMLEANQRMCQEWEAAGLDQLKIGVGINTGMAIVGNIGSPERMDYTVIGGAVNLASRLESMSKTLGSPLVIGEATVSHLEADYLQQRQLVSLGHCEVRGIAKQVKVFGLAPQTVPTKEEDCVEDEKTQ
jgi:adenylate cyclase